MGEEQGPPKPVDSNALALQRTELALVRTVIACERTLMAWIRTAISLIGFGFTLYKFFQYLYASKSFIGTPRPYAARNLGLTLIGIGTAALIVAAWQYRQDLIRLGVESKRQWSLVMIVALLMAMTGILAFVSILFRMGPY